VRAATEAVGDDLGSSWWWGGWPHFMAKAAWVWHHMTHIILQFPYSGVDFRDDPEMVLPPGEV
jgi:hypothetical protein